MVPLFFPENGPINSARPLLLEKEVYTGRHKAFSSFPHLRSLGAVPSYIFFLSFLPLPFPPLAGLFSFNVYNDLANLPRDLSLPLQHSGNLYSTRYSSVSPLFVLYLFFFFWRDWRDGDGEQDGEREREGKYVFLGSWANTYTHTSRESSLSFRLVNIIYGNSISVSTLFSSVGLLPTLLFPIQTLRISRWASWI